MTNAPSATAGYLQIGEAADRLELTQRTLRYYEEKGLLEPPTRMEGGFRLYSAEDMDRLARIRELKSLLGFSLAEIKEMLDAESVRMQIRSQWRRDDETAEKARRVRKAREVTASQIRLIDQKVERMSVMRQELAARMERYEAWLHHWSPDDAGVEATSS
jgi:DNA-binding transcriptional MerR regulator